MKVFITGGTGFIGSHLVVELLRGGDEVTVLARDPKKISSFQQTPGITVVQGSLDDDDSIRAAMPGHEACIHNALYWEDAPTELALKDTRAAVRIFAAAAMAGVRQLIYTSSTAVHRPFAPRMDESSRLAPGDFYGATKAAAEAFLAAFSHQSEMRCNTIRPGPTVGKPAFEGGPHSSDRRFPELVRLALRDEDIRVSKRDGRQFVGVGDVARLFAAVLHSGVNRQTFLGVSREFTTWEQIAHDVVTIAGSRSKVIAEDSGLPEPSPRFDVGKIEREFGLAFDCQRALREHLIHLVATMRS